MRPGYGFGNDLDYLPYKRQETATSDKRDSSFVISDVLQRAIEQVNELAIPRINKVTSKNKLTSIKLTSKSAVIASDPNLYYGRGLQNVIFPNEIPILYKPFPASIRAELSIQYEGEKVATLPHNYESLYAEINKSKYILDLEDNWDTEGSVAYSITTWKKAISFICDYANWTFDRSISQIITTPKILHGPDGTIDLLWENEEYTILLNYPVEGQGISSYYGKTVNNQRVEGHFNPESFNKSLLPIPVEGIAYPFIDEQNSVRL